jgi:hypothetical protein
MFLLAFFLCNPLEAIDISREDQIRAAYLYNLIKFVNWPGDNRTITTCVYSNNTLWQYLSPLTTREVKGAPISISLIEDMKDLEPCQIVYISQDNKEALARLPRLSHQPILTVGENVEFLENGGIVALVTTNNRIQIQINLVKAKEAGLTLSANLLEVAQLYR